MVDTDQRAVEEAVHEGESMRTRDLVGILEQYHDDQAGVPEAAIDAYAEELTARDDIGFDAEAFRDIVSKRRTDAEEWVDAKAIHEIGDGRLSQYPATWHDALHGETDPVEYIEFLQSVAPEFFTEKREDKVGIKQDQLAGIMKTIGGMDRQAADTAIEEARDAGRLEEDADQHPKAGVYLADG